MPICPLVSHLTYMSRERTSVFGIVVITMLVTSGLLAAGWYGAQKYFAQPPVSAPQEEPPAPVAKKKARPAKNAGRGGQDTAPPTAAASTTTATADTGAAAPGRPENEPFTSVAPATAAPEPAAVPEPPRQSAEAVPPPAAVDNSDARGIMVEVQRRSDANFYRYDGVLQTFDAKERMSEKRWTFDQLGSHGRSKVVVRFTSPPEVKGVALLIHNRPERASDQWMWTPAIERDRRIAMQDRSTRFFGTDFSFEDMEERDVDQYDYSMLGSETLEGVACWKIQSVPKPSRASQYTRSILWVRKDKYVLARLDNFVKDDIIRRLKFSTFENIQGYWTARQLDMSDLPRHTRTRLTLEQVKYNAPMKDEEFTLQAIRR
jgi:Outer membrane lipoprotein-sorting protein